MPENDTIRLEDIELDTLSDIKATTGKLLSVDLATREQVLPFLMYRAFSRRE